MSALAWLIKMVSVRTSELITGKDYKLPAKVQRFERNF
jgi:hypothetical protein